MQSVVVLHRLNQLFMGFEQTGDFCFDTYSHCALIESFFDIVIDTGAERRLIEVGFFQFLVFAQDFNMKRVFGKELERFFDIFSPHLDEVFFLGLKIDFLFFGQRLSEVLSLIFYFVFDRFDEHNKKVD